MGTISVGDYVLEYKAMDEDCKTCSKMNRKDIKASVPLHIGDSFKMNFPAGASPGEVTYGDDTFRAYIGEMHAYNVGGKVIRKFTVIEV